MPAACPGGLPQRFGRLPKDVRRSIAQRVRRRDYQNVSAGRWRQPALRPCVLQDYLSRYWADAPCAQC